LTHQRGHRVLRIVRKGGKASTEPLAPIVLHALEVHVDERTSGPIFLNADESKPGVVASGFCCALSLTGHAIVSAFFVASPRRQLRRMRMRALPPWRAQSPRRSI